jgi:hypothetical protein
MNEPKADSLQCLRSWVDSGKHLPRWLRDFHDQKDVFKACEDVLGQQDGISWRDGHVYTIDRFLRFMAFHGYTLRRTRAYAAQIEKTVADCKQRRDAECMRALDASRTENNKISTPAPAAPANKQEAT